MKEKQLEFWPREKTQEEINEELRKAGNYGRRKGEDLVSKEETTKALEEEGAKPIEYTPWKKGLEKVKEIIKKLERKD
jgi:hypothetical protein